MPLINRLPKKKASASASSLYKTFTQKNQANFIESTSDLKHWKDFYEPLAVPKDAAISKLQGIEDMRYQYNFDHILQLHHTFIVLQNNEGYLLIQQQNAHERVLYERYANAVNGKAIPTQQSLFPATINLAAADAVLLTELLPDLLLLGYRMEPFGNNTFVVQGVPADVLSGNETLAIEKILEQFKHFSNEIKFSKREKLLRSLAIQHAIKAGVALSAKEMASLLSDLFACNTPVLQPAADPLTLALKKMS